MRPVIEVLSVNKTYTNNFRALSDINLSINTGEIFALLGPNGAGKTTLINIICGIVTPSSGTVSVDGHDIIKDYRTTRSLIGYVPQELTTDAFETVWDTVSFSRGLFGKSKNPDFIADTLKKLSLWDKKDNRIITLSGGMKRRVMIAKALSHEPKILFLDEPTAGVDVQLRSDMWQQVRTLRESGVTIILTTHYIEEAEEMADRIGVINKGQLLLVEEKKILMKKMGTKKLTLDLKESIQKIPEALASYPLEITADGKQLVFNYDCFKEDNGVPELLNKLYAANIDFKDLHTTQSSLEEIFVRLVN